MSAGSTGSHGAGKRALPSTRLVQKKLRITKGQETRLLEYRALHEGKSEADALRDVINAGLRVVLQLVPPNSAIVQKMG